MARRKKKDDIITPILVLIAIAVLFFKVKIESIIYFIIAIFLVCTTAYFAYRLMKSRRKEIAVKVLPTISIKQDAPKTDSNLNAIFSVDLINSLDWKLFENICASYFIEKGRSVELTSLGADNGIDILFYENTAAKKLLGIAQCKAWSNKLVGVKEVRELYGVMAHVKCPLGVYFTTSNYSVEAKSFAKGKHLKLLTSTDLVKLLLELPINSQEKIRSEIFVGEYTTPSCPKCGIKLQKRVSKRVGSNNHSFWGCKNYPKCRYIMNCA